MTVGSEKEFLQYVLTALLEKPENITISETEDSLGTLFEITVDTDDMGKLIGKGGQTVKSLRTLLRMMGSKNEKRVNLKILEPVTT